uniref:Uncharacterized protein n=1 Tax=Oryza barthii TaxID=65489 RepID=A0A0D3GPJ6_9ORYZ
MPILAFLSPHAKAQPLLWVELRPHPESRNNLRPSSSSLPAGESESSTAVERREREGRTRSGSSRCSPARHRPHRDAAPTLPVAGGPPPTTCRRRPMLPTGSTMCACFIAIALHLRAAALARCRRQASGCGSRSARRRRPSTHELRAVAPPRSPGAAVASAEMRHQASCCVGSAGTRH